MSDTVKNTLKHIATSLEVIAGNENLLSARLILCHVLNCDLARLILCANDELSDEQIEHVNQIVSRRAQGEPLQYIFGTWDFMGLEFVVTSGALIPRQDTEMLVETALKLSQTHNYTTALDMCCGSGCIGLTLHRLGNLEVTLSDISLKCLALTQKNAEKLNAYNVKIIHSDMFTNISGTYDLITINPPYLTQSDMDSRQTETRFEPDNALFGGTDGLDFYRLIRNSYKAHLNQNGTLLMEIGAFQGRSVQNMFPHSTIIRDICGHDRVVLVK